MESRRWLNQTQPQTLQMGTILLYLNVVWLVLGGLLGPIGLIWIVASAAGGYGIANERKWGYGVGVAASLIPFALLLSGLLNIPLITLLFQGALVALLLHPQSRDYQRIWFK